MDQIFRGNIRTANLENGLKRTEFQSFQAKKQRINVICFLLDRTNLNRGQTQTLADAVLNRRDPQAILGLLKLGRKEDKGSTSGSYSNVAKGLGTFVKTTLVTVGIGKSSNITKEEALLRDANNFASSVSDSRFLSQLNTTPVDECLHGAIVDVEETAYVYLRRLIESLVDGLGQQLFAIQREECDKQIQREITSEEDKELVIIRSEFVHQVEDLSRERSRSYVH